ncbi:peptidase M1 [Corallococcus sp. H22C18031201]|uniref:M1 family aminopeptidase n=1 Tax=Citreicoccus inhibens TaxID=2849499 RepID=UPI000E731888|nr:M1 family aminopeptidase [Citreicoccus inhibens]MBU8899388.1 HEAT repeat domain-containing protein [Citreicoccus inhibens]RJS23938.1 peptidase M1 [Corallococcus sp. H22C18031201]
MRCCHRHAPAIASSEPHPFSLPGATEHYAAERPVRAEHIRLELDLDFEARALTGRCTTRVSAVRAVSTVTFDAVDMDITEARVDGRPARFSNSGAHARVELPEPMEPGQARDITLAYRCRPRRGLYFWGPDAGYPERPLQAWTQGQDIDARCWFPCLDTPAQKATTEVIATFPARMTSLSNGVLVRDVTEGERRTQHYRMEQPHSPYLVTLVVGEFEEATDSAGTVPLRYLYPPGRREDALRCVARTPQMVALYQQLTGEPFPWSGYAQVFVTEFILGGMEHTTATTLLDSVLHDARAHADYSAEPLIAHELAHQWFGNLLTCRDWPHGWLNEGFATYVEVLWKEHADGADEADQHRLTDLSAYLTEVRERYARPIVARKFHAPMDLFDRHLYEKGALVLHELRRRVGDDLFFRALRHYVSRHRHGVVETVDLSRAFEEATGHNLDRVFDQYVFSPGHPELKVEVRYDAEEARLRLKVRQTQRTDAGTPVFRLPLDVRVTVDGRDTLHRLDITDAEHFFHLPCPTPPTQVRVDPRREVLGAVDVDKAVGLWLEELRAAPEARARTEAAHALGKDGGSRAVEALGRALEDDALFWGTRAACAKALGRIRSPEARARLLAGLPVAHPKVRRAVVAALGEFRRDVEVAGRLRALLEAGDASYFVEAEAARGLGRVRAVDAVPLLEAVAARPSFQDVIGSGALDGLAETQDPSAFPAAVARTAYGQPAHMRRTAVFAVAKLAQVARREREAVDLLSDLLRDPQFRMQWTACEAAKTLGDRRMIAALEGTSLNDPRTRRAAREAVRALREGEPQAREVASLREEVDKLKEESRALREKLEALALRRPEPPPPTSPPRGRAAAKHAARKSTSRRVTGRGRRK